MGKYNPEEDKADRHAEHENLLIPPKLLAADGAIYICGDASKMAPDVRRAFATIYMSKTGADEPAAEAWLNDLVAAGRYVADVWAG